MKKLYHLCLVIFVITLLSACSEDGDKEVMLQQAVNIESADECHLCGMIISSFAGPKGELYKRGLTAQESKTVYKFCSTRDLFSFYLDPENKRNVSTILVHDMSKMPWDVPNDEFFIDAKTAWFVTGSKMTGAMGKTLASFSQKQDAELFVKKFGGKALVFQEIKLSVLM